MTRPARLSALAALALTALAAGCGSSHSSSAPAPAQTATASAKPVAPAAGGAKTTGAPKNGTAAGVPDTIHCVDVPRAAVTRIMRGIVLDGARLGRIEAVASPKAPGFYFVTGTVSGGGADANSLATWATSGLGGAKHVYAVDAFAALISTYGDAAELDPDLNIHERAAYQSRVCAGGPNATHGTPAPQSGIGNAPANG